ncbi:MAG: glycosyltransferase [Parasporobacterium sp.]|nr:glycosyltransferase [Parasporobacterium sp.]
MISVLFLIPTLDRGGAENVLVDLVNHMDQNKFRITVQTLFDKDSQKHRLKEGIEYKSFLYKQFHGNSRIMARIPAGLLYRIIVRKRYDVVVSYLEGPTTHIISGCPYADSKKVAWIHSAHDRGRGFSAGFRSKAAAIKVYKELDKIVCVAKTVKDKIDETAETLFTNSCVLYNTINAQEILQRSQEELGGFAFPEDEFCIISTGKITEVKGYDRLAVVQKKLKEEGYKTHVYILGTGKDKEKIEEYTERNGIKDSFTFLGFQENPYKYVAKADLFVCSSRREGFSTAVTEALILGVPVVSTNCSGAYELLGENNEYGIVTENDEEALLEGVTIILDDPVLLQKYRIAAKERGESFNSEQTVGEVEKMLLQICK